MMKVKAGLIHPSSLPQAPPTTQQISACILTPAAGEANVSPKVWRRAKEQQLRRMSQRRVPLRVRVAVRVM